MNRTKKKKKNEKKRKEKSGKRLKDWSTNMLIDALTIRQSVVWVIGKH